MPSSVPIEVDDDDDVTHAAESQIINEVRGWTVQPISTATQSS